MDIGTAQDLWKIDSVWLNTAQYGIPPRPAHEALSDAVATWRHGAGLPGPWGEAAESARRSFAALVGAAPEDIAQGATTSQLMGTLAASVPDGARVLVPEGEFTSAVFPWMAQADRGVRVQAVPLAELAGAVDGDTWLVVFSLVQSAGGELAPADAIVAAARRHGARVAVDATQAVGWLPVDATRYDALICSCYKWLMAPRGLAYGYLSPALRPLLRPGSAGPAAARDPLGSFYASEMTLADGAARFDISPNWFAGVTAARSMAVLLDIGVPRIRDHNVGLANRFRAALGLAPGDSAITSVEAHNAGERLRAADVVAAERAGRVRVSFHVYSTEEDADRAAEALI
ncbi:aminotransferase class V-fold PLP-dependent enzyme [Nocardiopsis sediminis]|uniref:Aminotransferase class V-fold PLP-dependent enzyme n=1 Tax=Nocardiopsis sediminis TaxID=1778267 RepID=A0ABV8FJY7_9ACTN